MEIECMLDGGIPGDENAIRYMASHDGARGDDGASSNPQVRKNGAAGADDAALADPDVSRQRYARANAHIVREHRVMTRAAAPVEHDVVSDHRKSPDHAACIDVTARTHARGTGNRRSRIDERFRDCETGFDRCLDQGTALDRAEGADYAGRFEMMGFEIVESDDQRGRKKSRRTGDTYCEWNRNSGAMAGFLIFDH
jgi:hypothetical protein